MATKPNGRPIGPPASYIMANDKHAAASFEALRKKGVGANRSGV
jgi:hypothetical protein